MWRSEVMKLVTTASEDASARAPRPISAPVGHFNLNIQPRFPLLSHPCYFGWTVAVDEKNSSCSVSLHLKEVRGSWQDQENQVLVQRQPERANLLIFYNR